MSLATGRETKAHCQACGIATTASPNAESRRAVWASTVAVPDGTDQAGNIGPQVGNIGPQAGNVVPQAAEAAGEGAEGAESASGVGNIVPHEVEETEKIESAACVSSVGNRVPRGVKKTSTSAEVSLSTSRVDNQVPHSESETPPVEKQCHVFDGVSDRQVKAGAVHLEALPEVSALLNLEELFMKDSLTEFKAGEIAEMVLLKPETSPEDLNSSSVMDEVILEGFTKQRATRLGSEILKNQEDPVYPLVKEYLDVVLKHPPSQLPPDRGARREIDLVPGTKYCVTRRWPLPRELCEVIDAFFAEKAKSGMVRDSKSPHSTPTFCVRKPNEKWRLFHAYNKLNNVTVPAQTPIPRKDVLLSNMAGCTLCSALDLVDGYYQILMRESDIPLTAVMRANKLYDNIDKCVFAAKEIQILGCFVSRVGVRADPGKVKTITAWPTPRSQKGLRKRLGLANYLQKYSAGYAELARPLSDLLKKDTDWVWERQHQDDFDNIKARLQHASVLALPDESKSFSVVCDASDYAIGCAQLQKDADASSPSSPGS
ncbi:Reverse transcriptase-rnase h-integrase [Phytophthora palmivora]|uniref:Reverse transcriptase-rnase h-integrase n=1 Tax=Phytophthora palmivora TaxID=4796 RepID=A0A2P4XJJ3_9STRA|nr:Reverse transcriptase-rnase h-integrase [Phytophthora palmivora]